MRQVLVIVGFVAVGFLLKLSLVEGERYLSASLVDKCLAQYNGTMSREQEHACFASPRANAGYRFISMLNVQPQLWKNLAGRCVEAKDEADQYFECRWWNRVAL